MSAVAKNLIWSVPALGIGVGHSLCCGAPQPGCQSGRCTSQTRQPSLCFCCMRSFISFCQKDLSFCACHRESEQASVFMSACSAALSVMCGVSSLRLLRSWSLLRRRTAVTHGVSQAHSHEQVPQQSLLCVTCDLQSCMPTYYSNCYYRGHLDPGAVILKLVFA